MIACVGETLEQREAGETEPVLQTRSRRSRSPPASTSGSCSRTSRSGRSARARRRRPSRRRRRTRSSRRCSTCRCSTAARSSRRTPPSCSRSRASTARSSAAPRSTSSRSRRFAGPRSTLVTLVILDGWGCAPPGPGNAVELAETPVFDRLWREYPHATLKASGEAVGLPQGQMGNSEVGHLTIGSGRILFQDLMRVNQAIEDGSLLRERGAASRRSSARGRAAATCTCSGSSRTAASTRTSTTCARCSSSRGRTGWRSGPGSTRSRTAATSRRPRRSRTSRLLPAGADRDGRRALLRDGPRPALGAHREGRRGDHRG